MQLPKKYRDIQRKLQVKKSKTGLGLYTATEIEKDGFVIEYVGELLTLKEANKRAGKYLFETNRDRFIDGTSRKNIARYINHSCKPNCEPEITAGRVFIKSIKRIESGEELTYDYGEEYVNMYIKPYGCRCASCMAKKK